MKREYVKPELGNAHLVQFEDAYTCDHSGVLSSCPQCGIGYNNGGNGYNNGGYGYNGINWSAFWAFISFLFKPWWK